MAAAGLRPATCPGGTWLLTRTLLESLPVAVCEPVTDMQRRGDFLEYVELLHEVRSLHPQGSVALGQAL